MPLSARLITSVPSEQRAQFVKLADERGVSVSHLLARLVHTAVAETTVEKFARLSAAALDNKAPAEKYTIRLMGADAARLEECAQLRGLTASGYVAHLLRAHLRTNPPMPYHEFQELKRVVNELASIRGALAQLASTGNSPLIDMAVRDNVLKLLPALKQIRQTIQDALVANAKSWEAVDG